LSFRTRGSVTTLAEKRVKSLQNRGHKKHLVKRVKPPPREDHRKGSSHAAHFKPFRSDEGRKRKDESEKQAQKEQTRSGLSPEK